MGIASPITDRLWALANYSASYAYPPLVTVSRSAISSLFQQIKVGQLKIVDFDGTTTVCGQQKLKADASTESSVYSLPVVELKVNKELFWVRLLLFADMVSSRSRLYIPEFQSLTLARDSLRVTCLERCPAQT